MKKPILALVPSAYNTSKLYTPIPINGDGDFTFSRSTTATRVNKDGLIEEVAVNIPRLDYSDSKCPSLLLEGASTNYLTNSGQLDLSLNPTRLTIEANKNIAPDGTLTASKMESFDLDSFGNFLTTSAGILTDRTFTFSVWLWTDEGKDKDVQLFLISSSESGSSNITITNIPTKYEFTFSFTSITVDSNLQVRIDLVSNNTYIYAWGGQLEESEVATSYIPTAGSLVTRAVDTCSNAGSLSLFEGMEQRGSIFVSFNNIQDGRTFKSLTLSNSSTSNRVLIRQNGNTDITAYVINSTGTKTTISSIINPDIGLFKVCFIWEQDNCRLYINGVKVGEDLTVDLIDNLPYSDFSFDGGSGGGDLLTAKYKDLRLYNETLTELEAIELTK